MKKGLVSLAALVLSVQGYTASNQLIWGEAKRVLPQFSPSQISKQALRAPQQPLTLISQQNTAYQLKPTDSPNPQSTHTRYQLTYKDIPIWGQQLIFHTYPGKSPLVTGTNITGIEHDLPSIEAQLSAEQAEAPLLKQLRHPVKFKTTSQVIFLDEHNKAHLAWHISFYTHTEENPISAPNYLVDANTGEVLQEWNEMHHERIGQGLGGNAFRLPYRDGLFQHGNALPGLPALGKFDVRVADGQCHVESDHVRVINLNNAALGYEAFPITIIDELLLNLKAYAYPCSESSLYLHYSDSHTGPVNYSFSPVNDTMYFAQQTIEMYEKKYEVTQPLGDDLPVRAFTHLGEMDNAFALPTIRSRNQIVVHQQIVIGNGNHYLTAPAQTVVAHELSHNFTALNSQLLYTKQSGGINEAFSDMAAIALQDYLREKYSWYWDGKDWALGREAVIGGKPLRYMDDPTRDGYSIDHAQDYHPYMNVHHSSGVFNKAFYLLANQPGWSIKQAFQIMVDANQHYWLPISTFDLAACGVIQAAKDRELSPIAVIDSFRKVGVTCPI